MRGVQAFMLLGLLLCGPGCTVFSDYGKATQDARDAFVATRFDESYQLYKEELEATNDSLLYHFEAATAAHFAKKYAESLKLFDVTTRKIEEYQERALAAQAGQVVASILTNEKAISYTGSVFEQVLTQAYQARNDFMAGKRDDVIVDIRRCYEIQDKAREIYDKELKYCEQEARVKNQGNVLDAGQVKGKLDEAYAYNGAKLAAPEDVYDIAWVRYLNAWLREALASNSGDYNQAWIDLRFVADRLPQVECVVQDLARMAEASGMDEDARKVREKTQLAAPPREFGSVALFFECGMAPQKREVKVIFPTYKGAAAVAVPVYESVPNPVAGAELILGDRKARTAMFSNLDSIAFRYHKDQLPLMIAKMVIRLIVKIGLQTGGTIAIEQSTKGTKDEGVGQLAALAFSAATSVWNVVSEQADLRCWRTLPQSFQATRVFLPAGEYPARIRLLGAGGGTVREFDLGTIKVAPRKHRMISARSLGTNLTWDVPAERYDKAPAAKGGKALVEGERHTRDVLGGEGEPQKPPKPQKPAQKPQKKEPSPREEEAPPRAEEPPPVAPRAEEPPPAAEPAPAKEPPAAEEPPMTEPPRDEPGDEPAPEEPAPPEEGLPPEDDLPPGDH